MRVLLCLCAAICLVPLSHGQDAPKQPVDPKKSIGVNEVITAGLTRPQIDLSAPQARYVGTINELKMMFPKEAEQERLKKEIDFDKQVYMVFVWQGSGGDVLTYSNFDDQTKIATFTIKTGLTDDVRRHFKMYMAPKGTTARMAPAVNTK